MTKKRQKDISVSVLKNNLLEVVRKVEKGQSFQITKANKPVAMLVPLPSNDTPVINYSGVNIVGDIVNFHVDGWTYDLHNIDKDLMNNS